MSAPMPTSATATLHDFSHYRRRKALRECGQNSRQRAFLWVQPRYGITTVVVFQPVRQGVLAALRATTRAG